MSLFTFIFPFRGGTYIKQVRAETIKDAATAWAAAAQKEKYGTDKLPSSLEDEFKDNELVPLKGLVNAWCTTLFTNKDFSILNVVKTVDSAGSV